MEDDIKDYLETHIKNSITLIFKEEILGTDKFFGDLFTFLQKTETKKLKINILDDINVNQRLSNIDKYPVLKYDLQKTIPNDIDQKLSYRVPNKFYKDTLDCLVEEPNCNYNDNPQDNRYNINFEFVHHDLFSIHRKVEIIGESDNWWILSYADLEWLIVTFSTKYQHLFVKHFIDKPEFDRFRYKSLKSVISNNPAFIGNPTKRKQFSEDIKEIFSNSFYEA